MVEKITSRGALEARLQNMSPEDLHSYALGLGVPRVPGMPAINNVVVRGRVIKDILDIEFKQPKSCSCGNASALYTVHRPEDDGPCFLYEPDPLATDKVQIAGEPQPIGISWGSEEFPPGRTEVRGFVHYPHPALTDEEDEKSSVSSDTMVVRSWGGTEEMQYVTIQGNKIRTKSGHHIATQILPEVLEKFLAKNADYGDQHREGLGPRAEYVGIHRKVYKLKSALWEGREMNSEGAREMLTDLIGQCLIVLDLLDQEEDEPKPGGWAGPPPV